MKVEIRESSFDSEKQVLSVTFKVETYEHNYGLTCRVWRGKDGAPVPVQIPLEVCGVKVSYDVREKILKQRDEIFALLPERKEEGK